MDLRGFHNRLRVMTSIDRHDLIEAGIESMREESAWRSFQGNPYRWLIACDDDSAEKLWTVIQRRAGATSVPAPTAVQKGAVPSIGGVAR